MQAEYPRLVPLFSGVLAVAHSREEERKILDDECHNVIWFYIVPLCVTTVAGIIFVAYMAITHWS